MNSKIYIRALLFCFQDSSVSLAINRRVQLFSHHVTTKLTLYDFNLSNMRTQSSEKYLLPDMHIRIGRLGADICGEVLDADDVVLWSQNPLAQLFQIEPLIFRALQGRVIEIETVDVNSSSSHCSLPEKARASEEAP